MKRKSTIIISSFTILIILVSSIVFSIIYFSSYNFKDSNYDEDYGVFFRSDDNEKQNFFLNMRNESFNNFTNMTKSSLQNGNIYYDIDGRPIYGASAKTKSYSSDETIMDVNTVSFNNGVIVNNDDPISISINQKPNDYNYVESADYSYVKSTGRSREGWTTTHEEWVDDEYVVEAITVPGVAHGSDEDSIVIYRNNGNIYEQIAFIDLKETIGFKESDLIDGNNYKIWPTANVVENDIQEFFHINSFDVNKQSKRLFVNSKVLSSIFIFNLVDLNNIYLEMVLSNPATYNYLYHDNSNQDPIMISNDSSESQYHGYTINPEYKPSLGLFEDKALDYEVNNVVYSAKSVDNNSDWLGIDQKYLFGGEHSVRNVNSFLENSGILGDNYKSNHEYITIFDNHYFKQTPYALHEEKIGPSTNSSDTSYFKLIDIDPSVKKATLISNFELEFSPYVSNTFFIQINESNYIFSYSGRTNEVTNSELSISKFDYINPNLQPDESLINREEIFNLKLDFIGYRAVPIFENFSDINYGWGLYY